ncbi:MAG: IS4 family transposase [Enterococcus sp.]|nr:IS4 family transposase [Enterococcus sp.]
MSKFSPEKLKKSLFDSIDSLLDERELYLVNPAADFTRNKLISFRQTMLFYLSSGNGTLSSEMLDFFKEQKLPTASAMIQQRNKIKAIAYEDLFRDFTGKLPVTKKMKGLQLVAVDGSHLNVPYNPKDSFSHTNCIEGRKGFNQLLLNAAYDPLNNLYLDAIVQGYHSMNESRACCTMIDRHSASPFSTVFIMDRGYSAYNVIAHAIHNSQYFVLRAKASFARSLSKTNEMLQGTDEFDEDITVHLGFRSTYNGKYENYHAIKRTPGRYDYLHETGDIDRLSFRVLQIKIKDSQEYIITNLPRSTFSSAEISNIYNLRWNEEVSFRELKYDAKLISFHSKTHEFQIQEIFAKLTAFNFCSEVIGNIEPSDNKNTKHEYRIEKSNAFKVCIKFLKGLVKNVVSLISKKKVPVRLNRIYPRNLRRQSADTLNYR